MTMMLFLHLLKLLKWGLRTELRLHGLLLLDVVEGHPDDGLLELLGLAGALLRLLVRLALLVHAAPSLRPAQLDSLDPLVEQGVRLRADEKAGLAILGHEPLAAPRVDAVLRVSAQIGFGDHRNFERPKGGEAASASALGRGRRLE